MAWSRKRAGALLALVALGCLSVGLAVGDASEGVTLGLLALVAVITASFGLGIEAVEALEAEVDSKTLKSQAQALSRRASVYGRLTMWGKFATSCAAAMLDPTAFDVHEGGAPADVQATRRRARVAVGFLTYLAAIGAVLIIGLSSDG